MQSKAIEAVNNSPRVAAQRVQLGGMVGAPAQLQAGPEEDELQMKAASDVLQRRGLEEEELLQGKFDVAQKVEEDEQLQGKFEAVQRVEDEEPLQGKFETVQRVEEEELLQGRFVPVQLKQELLSRVVFARLNQAAIWSSSITSIPSLNLIPVTTFAR